MSDLETLGRPSRRAGLATPRRRQRGMGLIMAIFLITLGATLTAAVLRSVGDNADAFVAHTLSTRALMSAESGAQLMLNQLFPPAGGAAVCSDASWDLDDFGLPACTADATCTSVLVDGQSIYSVQSSGTCDSGIETAVRIVVVQARL